jgi:hypothetical protein
MAEFSESEKPQLAKPVEEARKGRLQELWSDFERRTSGVLAEFFEDENYPFSKRIEPRKQNFLKFLSSTEENFLKFLLSNEASWNVKTMRLFLKEHNQSGIKYADEILDRTRRKVVEIAKKYAHDPMFEIHGRERQPEEQAEFLRWFFSMYVNKLVRSTKGNKTPVDTQVKGITWSLLAQDAKLCLREFGQTINSKWLFDVISPLILRHYEPEDLEHELERFIRKDPQVVIDL